MSRQVGEGFDLPDGHDGWTDWTWFHPRAAYPQRFTILCNQPVHYAGHYTRGRMLPCIGDKCLHCANGIGRQVRYVFSVVEWETRLVGLLELGRGHAIQIRDWIPRVESLRGMTIEVQRSAHSKHSRIDMSFVEDVVPVYFHRLQGPDLKLAVQATFDRGNSRFLRDSLLDESRQRESGG